MQCILLSQKNVFKFHGLCVLFAVEARKIIHIMTAFDCLVMCILNIKTEFLSSPTTYLPSTTEILHFFLKSRPTTYSQNIRYVSLAILRNYFSP